MPHRHSSSLTNPLVGIYFGIFSACLAAIVILLLILEQLGVTQETLKLAMAVGAMLLFATVGAGAYTSRMREFATAGRRVPAFYSGLGISVATIGGAGLTGLSGALFLAGHDMLFLGLGLVAGLAVMVMLIAPFLRKFGAPTVPGYLGMRFESGTVRLLGAAVAVVPLLLLLVAEIKIAVTAASWLTPLAPATTAALVVILLVGTVAPGGARSLAWSSAAQALAVLVAVLVPASIAAVMETNLPFSQLTHGPLMRAVGRLEAAQEVPVPLAGLLTLEIPGAGLQAITGRFGTVFGSIGPLAFVLATLSVVVGIAGSPALLTRTMSAPTVFECRKAIAWAVVLVGLLVMTLSAVAVFERHILMTAVAGQPAAKPPASVVALVELGLAAIDPRHTRLQAGSLLVDRDATLVAMPLLLGLPAMVTSLVAAGILAAALAAAAASLSQIGLILGEDVINAPDSWRSSDLHRLTTCRLAIGAAAGCAGLVAGTTEGNPLLLMLLALSFSGSALFPVLLLSIWWKRLNAYGAIAGISLGFVVALTMVGSAEIAGIGLSPLLAPAIAAPLAIAVAMLVSHLTGVPDRHILELVRDLRVPGGETLYDREVRQARQRHPQLR
jgi:cation/acetate symporter